MATPTPESVRLVPLNTLPNIPVPLEALCVAGLSPTQWVLLFLIYYREELPDALAALAYCENKPLLWTNDDLNDLVDRFYLIHEPNPKAPSKTDVMNFRCSERFFDLLHMVKPAWQPPKTKMFGGAS